MHTNLQETDLLKINEEIEKLRSTLYEIVNLNNNLLDPELLKISLMIDKLIVKHIYLSQPDLKSSQSILESLIQKK